MVLVLVVVAAMCWCGGGGGGGGGSLLHVIHKSSSLRRPWTAPDMKGSDGDRARRDFGR